MKKNYLLVVLFLLYYGGIVAQTVNTSVASQMNTIFGPLEKNRIPNNILLDYGIEFIDISKYDGVLRTDNYINTPVYKDTYNSLVSARTALGVPGLEAPLQEEAEWKTLQIQKNNKIPNTASMVLSGLYYNYSQIRSDALANNKIKVVNGTYDDSYVNGVWQNPYETKSVFALTAPIQQVNQPNVSVSLPETLWHTNQASVISNIQVDFGNGTGYKSLTNNALAITYYNTAGVYIWTYRLQLTNGQYISCRQKVKVNVPTATKSNSNCLLQTQSITASDSYLGVAGKATLQISYGSSDCKLRKPLIVAEGLDTGLLGATGRIGDSDIETFTERIHESNSIELQNLITNNTDIDYDVVYVNWDNGTDYLQRNAYVLEEVIKWVNQQKAANGSTTPNVVLGQSMGGVIARYALRDMENRNKPHNTSLYISHDAPHQGAHVPLGLLYMARHVVDQFISTPLGNISIPVNGASVGLGTASELLDAPAVKQMLINYVNSSFYLDNNVHDTWQNELKALGYPQLTRNIALSNGSHCASPQKVIAGQRLLTIDAYGKTTALTDIIMSITGLGVPSAVFSAILLDEPNLYFGILPGRSKFDLDFSANAFPASGTSQIYYGKITYTKTLLWLVKITTTLTQRSKDSSPGVLPLDTYPGGKNPSFENINISNFESNAFVKYGYTIDFEPGFNFIPVTSALDVGKNNVSLTSADYLKVYTAANPPTGTKAIPFVNFTTSFNSSSINEPHITFNRTNGDWLAEEMDSDNTIDIFDCSYLCNNAGIVGQNYFCSGSQTYSIPVSNVTWSISNSTLASIVPNGNTVTVTKKGNGTVTLKANIPVSKCGPAMTISKTIDLGTNVNIVLQSDVSNYEAKALITGNGISSTPTYTILYSYGSATLSMINHNDGSYTIWGKGNTNTWYKDVRVTTTTVCGTETKDIRINPPAPSGGCNYTLQSTSIDTYSLLPPPDCLSSMTTMNSTDTPIMGATENTISNIYSITVYDLNSNVVLQTDEQSISLESLKVGFYIIKAVWNGNEMTKKVAKQ